MDLRWHPGNSSLPRVVSIPELRQIRGSSAFPSPASSSSADSQGSVREKEGGKISSGKEQSWCVTALPGNPLVAGIRFGSVQNAAGGHSQLLVAAVPPRLGPVPLPPSRGFSLHLCFPQQSHLAQGWRLKPDLSPLSRFTILVFPAPEPKSRGQQESGGVGLSSALFPGPDPSPASTGKKLLQGFVQWGSLS